MMFRHEVPDDPVEMPTTGSFLGAALRPMLTATIRIEAMQRSLKNLLFIQNPPYSVGMCVLSRCRERKRSPFHPLSLRITGGSGRDLPAGTPQRNPHATEPYPWEGWRRTVSLRCIAAPCPV